MEFNFDQWRNLALEDPEAFEALRKKTIEEAIQGTYPATRHLVEGLQFQIDMARRKSKHPMKSCIQISNMMKEKFYTDFSPLMKEIASKEHSLCRPVQDKKERKIIPLKKGGQAK